MELTALVTAAKLGDSSAFAVLVRRHQARLIAGLARRTGDRQAAEDLSQEVFLTAWEKLGALREAQAFSGWLAAMARHRAADWLHRRARLAEAGGDLVDQLAWPEPTDPGDLGHRVAALPEEGRRLWRLRHSGGLSLRQIGAVLRIPEHRVKSRLYELRRRLVKPLRPLKVLEEELMDRIQALKLGAHVVERLSLDDQLRLVRAVLADQEWDERLLESVGRVDRGAEYLALYGVRPTFGELIGVLNHIDRFTEHRLVTQLEATDPPAADRVKRHLFVFEDLCLFAPEALGAVYRRCDPAVFAAGLTGVAGAEKNAITARMPPADRVDLDRRLAGAESGPWAVRAAQETVVAEVQAMERAGSLRVVREGGPEGPVTVVLAR